VFLLSSLTLEQLQAQGMLRLKRSYWIIESRLHHCLDITMHEDHSRVRTPNSALVLGMIRRVILSFSNAAVDKAFFAGTKVKSNFICSVGHGDPAGAHPILLDRYSIT
jgi:hypothetical protein